MARCRTAIAEAGLTTRELPEKLPAGYGAVKYTEPNTEAARNGMVRVTLVPVSENAGGPASTWPAAGTALVAAVLPAGDYYAVSTYLDASGEERSFLYGKDGWTSYDPNTQSPGETNTFHVGDGEVVELGTKGLG